MYYIIIIIYFLHFCCLFQLSILLFMYVYRYLVDIFFQVADIVVMMMTMATNSDTYIIYICRKGEQKLN